MTKQEVIAKLKNKIAECESTADERFKRADNAWDAGNKEEYNFLCDRGNMYYKMARAYKEALQMVESMED